MSEESRQTIRLDKWLWHARFFKTRSLAAKIVSSGKVRVDSMPVSKPARAVGPGNVLTFAQGDAIRVAKITAIGERRGPAVEAQTLYEDLSEPVEKKPPAAPRVGPRPTKRERRVQQALIADLNDD